MISVCNRPEMWNKDVVNNDTSPPNSRDTLSPLSASVAPEVRRGRGGLRVWCRFFIAPDDPSRPNWAPRETMWRRSLKHNIGLDFLLHDQRRTRIRIRVPVPP
jgi:hypothetical protein